MSNLNQSDSNKNIVFIAMALSQPRCIKRITSFQEYGFDCTVYGYDRGKYDINDYPKDIPVHHLGMLKDNEYIRKSFKVLRDVIKIRRTHKGKDTVFYAFGFFQALYLRILRKKYVYEISDILYAYPKFKRVMRLLKSLDKRIIRGSLATVMTSGGFYSFFGIESSNVFIIPNKVSPSLKRPTIIQISKEKSDKLAFGFVGSLRYQTILDFAQVVGESFPQHEFHFWGGLKDGPMKDAVDGLVSRFGNVYYHGAFRSPDDLPTVYDTFDITVSCYQVSSLNERIAEPNKLYESMFFCKPIVVSDGIYLSERVKELECGYCIDASSKESIFKFISSLNMHDVRTVQDNISLIDKSQIVNDQDSLNEYVWMSFKK